MGKFKVKLNRPKDQERKGGAHRKVNRELIYGKYCIGGNI